MSSDTGTNQYKARWEETEQKLQLALDRLIKGKPRSPKLQGRKYRLCPSTLATEAEVSRTAIYTGHRSFLKKLDEAKQNSEVSPQTVLTTDEKFAKLRNEIRELRDEIKQLATQNAKLLLRAIDAERQLSGLRTSDLAS